MPENTSEKTILSDTYLENDAVAGAYTVLRGENEFGIENAVESNESGRIRAEFRAVDFEKTFVDSREENKGETFR